MLIPDMTFAKQDGNKIEFVLVLYVPSGMAMEFNP